MIDELQVSNIALIREATLVPSAGLTVLTGETGAGKTALLSALKLILGERADSSTVREGEALASVEARLFDGPHDTEGFTVQRSLSAEGRSRVKIDGRIASVRELSERVGVMMDLCGQHEHQRLLDPAHHVAMVDAWAGRAALEALEKYQDKFEQVAVAEPLLGEVGDDATVINADKEAVAKAVVAEEASEAGFKDAADAADQGTAFVLMGHGTAHVAKVTYSQMQTQMQNLGYSNVFIGTVEGEPEETSCESVIEAVKAAGYKNVVLRPLMVVAGDHANNDMAGDDDDSWKSQFEASGAFDKVDTQISGLGRIKAVESFYVAHTRTAIESISE